VAAYFDQQRTGADILIIEPVPAQDRPGQAGVQHFHAFLPLGGKAEVQPPVGQLDGAAVIAPGNDHDLCSRLAVQRCQGAHTGIAAFHRVAVYIQHHFDAGVFFQVAPRCLGAAGVTFGVAGGIMQGGIVQGGDPGIV